MRFALTAVVALAVFAAGFAARGQVLPSPQTPATAPPKGADPVADLRADVDARLQAIAGQLTDLAAKVDGLLPGPTPPPVPPVPTPPPAPPPPPTDTDPDVVAAAKDYFDGEVQDAERVAAWVGQGHPLKEAIGMARALHDARKAKLVGLLNARPGDAATVGRIARSLKEARNAVMP